MEKLQKYLEYQKEIALIILGLASIFYGFYLFFELKQFEETNQVVQMKRYLRLIYDQGGKFSVLALFEIIGIALVFFGVKQLREIK